MQKENQRKNEKNIAEEDQSKVEVEEQENICTIQIFDKKEENVCTIYN